MFRLIKKITLVASLLALCFGHCDAFGSINNNNNDIIEVERVAERNVADRSDDQVLLKKTEDNSDMAIKPLSESRVYPFPVGRDVNKLIVGHLDGKTALMFVCVSHFARQLINERGHAKIGYNGYWRVSRSVFVYGQNTTLEAFANIRSLSFSSEYYVSDLEMHMIARHCPSLTSLNLSTYNERTHCMGARESITDAGFKALARHSSNFKFLDLTGCTRITDMSILYLLAEGCNSLVTLNLTRIRNLTDASIMPLAAKCTALKSLTIEKCSGASIRIIADQCKELSVFSFGEDQLVNPDPGNIVDEDIIYFAENCKSITDLKINGCNLITGVGIRNMIPYCQKLTHLGLLFCKRITYEDAKTLTRENLGRVRIYHEATVQILKELSPK